jgi:transcriptional regulator with XRE-family HTH domain
MAKNSSTALPESQAPLHCLHKAALYNIEMTLGKRIKAARERLRPKPTQGQIGAHFGVTDKAVSGWERDQTIPELDKIADLARLLRVPCSWLLEGTGAPPSPDALEVKIESLRPSERALLAAMIETIHKERESAA